VSKPLYTKMAVDFGTSNTVVAFWDDDRDDVVLHHVPDVTLPFRFRQDGEDLEIPYIPSLIYYRNANIRFVGYQVIGKSLERKQGAFRWMKAYIQSRRRIKYPLPDGTRVDYFQAGRDFLESVLLFASEYVDINSAEIAFTVPVESFEHYAEWLSDACVKMKVRRYRFIDESSACIFGYETHLQAGDVFLIFDFGGGTLDVSVVRIEEQVRGGKGCRVLGKAGCDIGGRIIDGWIYKDLLHRAGIHDIDARQAGALFMLKVEEIKEQLSSEMVFRYDIKHTSSSLRMTGLYHRAELEDLLEKNGLYHNVQSTIERAVRAAEEKGTAKNDIKEALLVGGSSQIPSIRRQVRIFFGDKTRAYRPYDAAARGACRYLTSGIEALYDHIQHDYAIRDYDPKTGRHRFSPLVPRGTHYPTEPDFKRLTMKAVRNGQRFLGIDIYEVAEEGSYAGGTGELVFDLNGGLVFDNQPHAVEAGTEFWMNEHNPTFIEADPPARRGEPRFAVTFRVDAQKRLLVTVFDIITQKHKYKDHPVVKLK